jgi:hypothetical protein
MKVSQKAALAILEVLTSRIGNKIESEDRNNTLSEILLTVGNDFEAVVDAADLQQDMIAERLMQLATSCVIAVASMVAGADAVEDTTVVDKTVTVGKTTIDIEAAAIRARQLMIDRAAKNNIVIPESDIIN